VDRRDATRAGIAAARERGVEWGSAGKIRAAENSASADQFAESLRPLLIELMSRTRATDRLAYRLNQMGLPTPRGGRWHRATVHRLIERLGDVEAEVAVARDAGACAWWHEKISYQKWRQLRGLGNG